MKALVITNDCGGLYNFRFELIASLRKHYTVCLCLPPDQYSNEFEKIGCTIIPCNLLNRRSTNPVKDIKLFQFYRKTIREEAPDVVLTYTIKPNVYGGLACALSRIPYIANVTGLGTTIENGGALAIVSKSLYRIGLRKASCVFFQNSANRKLFVDNGITKGKTRVIPGSGVNLNKHSFEPYPSDENAIRFLFIGRIMKDKGVEELLEAIRQIHKEDDKVTLDVVGYSDEDYSESLNAAESEGAIKFHGLQRDVHSFYKSCHCAVLPSYHEGTANVMLEASSTGRPVITTRVPGCQETFDEGITGFGCEAKDTESLIDAMRKFLETPRNKREAMGIAARHKMEMEYDRNIVLKAYDEEIHQTTQKR